MGIPPLKLGGAPAVVDDTLGGGVVLDCAAVDCAADEEDAGLLDEEAAPEDAADEGALAELVGAGALLLG